MRPIRHQRLSLALKSCLRRTDLERARTWGLVTGTDLHAMYLVTPTWDLDKLTPNWQE